MRSTILALLSWFAVLPFVGSAPKAEAMLPPAPFYYGQFVQEHLSTDGSIGWTYLFDNPSAGNPPAYSVPKERFYENDFYVLADYGPHSAGWTWVSFLKVEKWYNSQWVEIAFVPMTHDGERSAYKLWEHGYNNKEACVGAYRFKLVNISASYLLQSQNVSKDYLVLMMYVN